MAPRDHVGTHTPVGSYRFEFTAGQSGTYFYHSHDHVDRQQALGLYGALFMDPASPDDEMPADHDYVIQLQEWLMREGLTFSSDADGWRPTELFHHQRLLNGCTYPATDTIRMKVGETLKVRSIGTNNGFIHPMHMQGGPFEVVARVRRDDPVVGPFLGRYGECRTGAVLGRRLASAPARQVAHPLSHRPPHDQQQRQGKWRRRIDVAS